MSNTLHSVGRLADDATLTETASGKKVAKFTLLHSQYRGDSRDADTTNLPFTAFGKTAEAIANNTLKGDQLIVTGHIENNNYEDREGNKRYSYNFIVDSFEFGAPGTASRERLAQAQKAAAARREDKPRTARSRKAAAPAAAPVDDDIPF